MFCLMVFAMFGLQVYKGALRQKCVKEVTGYVTNPSKTYAEYYAEWIRDSGKICYGFMSLTIKTY